jgi:hypothetical protein
MQGWIADFPMPKPTPKHSSSSVVVIAHTSKGGTRVEHRRQVATACMR